MYNIKWWQELGWAVLTAVVVVIAEAMITFDETVFTDWRTWVIGLVVSLVRVVGATVVNEVRRLTMAARGPE